MFLSLFCIASEYQPLCNNLLFGGGAPPAAWQTSPVFFIVLGLALHRRMLHFYLEIAQSSANLERKSAQSARHLKAPAGLHRAAGAEFIKFSLRNNNICQAKAYKAIKQLN